MVLLVLKDRVEVEAQQELLERQVLMAHLERQVLLDQLDLKVIPVPSPVQLV
jgi:hypothetical protein